MKPIIIFLVAAVSTFSSWSKPITATVIFENLSAATSVSGTFYVAETNQTLQINTLAAFTIELPRNGKYHFRFDSEQVNAFTSYPARMTNNKNTITIQLKNKNELENLDISLMDVPIKDLSNFSDAQLEAAISAGTLNFITHGLVAIPVEAAREFKDSFGVGFFSKNCTVDPLSYKTAKLNNLRIATFLISKYSNAWKSQLPAQPLGI